MYGTWREKGEEREVRGVVGKRRWRREEKRGSGRGEMEEGGEERGKRWCGADRESVTNSIN